MADFTGCWKSSDTDNLDAVLKDLGVSLLIRQGAKLASSEHHITHTGDHMKVEVHATAKQTKVQDYNIGDSFEETEMNGMQSQVKTEWQGKDILSTHTMPDGVGYTMLRELTAPDVMTLHLTTVQGTKAKRVYKKK